MHSSQGSVLDDCFAEVECQIRLHCGLVLCMQGSIIIYIIYNHRHLIVIVSLTSPTSKI